MARAANKAPAYQWFSKDWQSDEAVKVMSYEQRGIYRELLDHQWLEGSIPAAVPELAASLKIPLRRFEKIWPAIAKKFKPKGRGRLANRRLERQRAEQIAYYKKQADNGRKGAAAKHQRAFSGATGGATNSPQAISSSASASASADLSTPPLPPASRGALRAALKPPTRQERAWAEQTIHDYRESTGRACPHNPDCNGQVERCIGALVQAKRIASARGQELVISKSVSYKKAAS